MNNNGGTINNNMQLLETVLHTRSQISQVSVDLAWRTTQNQRAESVTSQTKVGERAKDMDFGAGQHNASFCHIFDGHFGAPIFARNTSNCTTQMLAVQELD